MQEQFHASSLTMGPRVNTIPERLNAVLKYAHTNNRILDLGTGSEPYVRSLSARDFWVVGLDRVPYQEWVTQAGDNFVLGDGSCLPFSDRSFDLTIAFEVLEHIENPRRALAEIARCTSDKFICSVPNCDLNNALRRYDLAMAHWTDPTHCNFFTVESVQTLLEESGFTVIEVSDCYRISPNEYFWSTIRIPWILSRLMKKFCERFDLVETYWSSILVVSDVPGP